MEKQGLKPEHIIFLDYLIKSQKSGRGALQVFREFIESLLKKQTPTR